MKYIRLFLCLLLILTLSACGTDVTQPSTEHGNNPSAPTTTDPSSSGPAPADMWFNAEGQYGTVEYTYDQSGKLEKTIFYYHSGKVWRTIEHYVMNDNAYPSLLYCQSIYNANGTLLYSLQETRQDKANADYQIPSYVSVYDHFYQKSVCSITYGPAGGAETFNRSKTYYGAQDYAIIHWKNATQMDKITLYYREGSQKATLFMHYEADRLVYIGYGADYMDSSINFYKVEYTDGQMSHLIYGIASINSSNNQVQTFTADTYNTQILLSYDASGRITQIDSTDRSFRYIWNYTYEGDALSSTEYLYGRRDWDLQDLTRGHFTWNTDGTMATADYGFLGGSLGGGDTSYYVFTYYPSGIVSHIQGYFESAYSAGSDDLDLEWEYFYAEDGTKISD